MATTRHVVFVDDLDGSTDGVEAVWFGLGDDLYEIDLSPPHREALLTALGPFLAAARTLADAVDDDDVGPAAEDAPPPAPRAPRPPRPPREPGLGAAQRRQHALEAARRAPLPYEHPDYPWIPFTSGGRLIGEQVRRWAATQDIPMPHKGLPRSVLEGYWRHLKVAGTT